MTVRLLLEKHDLGFTRVHVHDKDFRQDKVSTEQCRGMKGTIITATSVFKKTMR